MSVVERMIDKIHMLIVSKQHGEGNYNPNVEQWNELISSMANPSDSIERSHHKYVCRMFYFSKTKRIILNSLCFFALIISIPTLLFVKKTKSGKKNIILVEKDKDVEIDDVFPEVLAEEFDVHMVDNFTKYFGTLTDDFRKLYFQCIKRYTFDFYYLFFLYREFVAHSFFIAKYNPRAVAVYVNERNIATPIITEIYEKEEKEFVSFMHGEYLLQLIQAFSSFSRYYVWDESYIEMFKDDLKWRVNHYVVYTPEKLKKKWDLTNDNPAFDYTYYLCDATIELIDRVLTVLNQISLQGYRCSIRQHPRERQFNDYVKKKAGQIAVENIDKMSLKDSFRDTKYVVGLKSTCLYEAEAEGKTIVIDDVSDPDRFKGLKQTKCRLLNKQHILLSDMMKNSMNNPA